MLPLFVAAIGVTPPNWLKSTLTVVMGRLLLSPLAVLSHLAVTVSPIWNAPDGAVAPLRLMCAAVTVGATLSTLTLFVPVVVCALPAMSAAVIATLKFVVLMDLCALEVVIV